MTDPEKQLDEAVEDAGRACPCCRGKREHHFPDVRPAPVPCRACGGKGTLEI